MARRIVGLLGAWLACAAGVSAGGRVAIVSPEALPAEAKYGLAQLELALEAKGFETVRTERAAGARADFLVTAALRKGPAESLSVRTARVAGMPGVALAGADGRGLMYAALDTAARVAWTKDGEAPFAHVRDVEERPAAAERAVSMYTMQRGLFEKRLYDEAHWKRYFGMLAASRINSFVVIFGYENGGFMAPAYPYFFDTAGFDGVRLVGITPAQQRRNAEAFRAMIRIAHERGVDVTAAIWDHIYRGGVQGGGIPGASELAGKDVPGLVKGVTEQNLIAYTKAALRRFLEEFPEIDALQFRMHGESGLKREEMEGFWHDVFGMMKRTRPDLRVDLRAKELPDSIINDALKQGLKARVTTKYWMEQMGLPFHPSHVNRQNQRDRRHGYADLLKYPQSYKVHWRLWNGGTARLLLWGDPEYVRRFVESTKLYGGESFEVNEMLATWMLGEPHEAAPKPNLNARYRYFDDEYERYWHFFQVWGRVSYNPATPAEVWEREFARRFGAAAGPHVMNALHEASKVLPRIVASAYRYQMFPTTRGWAEMMRQGDLRQYADLEGSDIEQFESPRDFARRLLAGTDTAKRSPESTSAWFEGVAARILKEARLAESTGSERSNELIATLTDVRILAGLASYHAARLPAAVMYNLYRETGDPAALEMAIGHEKEAIAEWERIVAAAGDVYSEDLAFGAHAVGFSRHWKEELALMRRGLESLEAERKKPVEKRGALPASKPHGADVEPPVVVLPAVAKAKPGADYTVAVKVSDASGVKSVRLRYRHVTQYEDYGVLDMILDAKTGHFVAKIPGFFIVPAWDLMYFVEAVDTAGNGRIYPDLDTTAPYVIVPVAR